MSPKVMLVAVILVLAVVFGRVNAQPAVPGVAALVRHSDFIGFVQTGWQTSDPYGAWRQGMGVNSVDPVKGVLVRDPAFNNQFPYLWADAAAPTAWPAWFGEKGEYLVFLRHDPHSPDRQWTANAVYLVSYQPEALGRVVGRVGTMEVTALHTLLTQVVAGEGGAAQLGAVLRQAPPPHVYVDFYALDEHRMRDAQTLAALVLPGTTRADINKVFPEPDGGLMSSAMMRYYLGGDVMVDVPFDTKGGPWQQTNTVNGPLRVYQDHFHSD